MRIFPLQPHPFISTLILAIACLGVYFYSPTIAAQSSFPSPEQCTCDLKGQPRTGAKVVNAGSCMLRASQTWCNIYIPTVESTEAQTTLVTEVKNLPKDGADGAKELSELFGKMMGGYLQSRPVEEKKAVEADSAAIQKSVFGHYHTIDTCIQEFKKGPHKFYKNSAEVSCGVGPESGWLSVSFQFDEAGSENNKKYIFLVSPNE